ncbi:MAG: hypothetical protein Q9M18_03470, partial [Mariprofundaceae bacterium]|nr:hypothetical protein [Mariprofundaceae bacterium]
MSYFLYGLLSISFIHYIGGESIIHPLNASNDLAVKDITLQFSWWGSVLEPLSAPIHILATFPDIRIGMLSFFVWGLICLCVYLLYFFWKHHNIKEYLWISAKIIGGSLFYFIFILLVPLPNWILEKPNSTYIVSDLHSHTLLSHDGVVTLSDNLNIHQQRGYDIVALTNHASLQQNIFAYPKKNTLSIINGLEIPVYYGGHFYLSVLGMEKGTPLPNGLAWYEGNKTPLPPASLPDHLWSVKKLIRVIHKHGGVVAVVALYLDVKEVQNLAQIGVDAFEIVNFGHHSLHQDVRQAMLQAQKERGIALIASNDWHGWTGVLNTWTLIQADPLLKDESLEVQVMDALKHHGQKVIPLTAYPIHNMTIQEMIFA